MINWRKISEVGMPTDTNEDYLVSDGKFIESSELGQNRKGTYFTGSSSTYEDNPCCSGPVVFDFSVSYWCPTSELNLPK